MNFGHIKKIHFVGIGGIGMSGIAEILQNYDLEISGCDVKASPVTERLSRNGIDVLIGHDAGHIAGADLIVVSSAIRADSEEVVAARAHRIPVIRRAEMLGEIMRLKRGIAIAGTHGKTTTSALTAMVLRQAGLDPTVIVGGMLHDLDGNSRLGQGELLVVEADEYDRSFLTLHPSIAVVTNIEADHLDCYRDLDDIRATFAEFVSRVPFYGVVIGCVDDENVTALLASVERRTIGYGLSPEAELRAVAVRHSGTETTFDITRRNEPLGRVSLRIPGEHNVRNALAAIAVALDLDVPFERIAEGIAGFTGVQRRFQLLGTYNDALIVDDYAHHPTEIRATLQAARNRYPERRLVALFQPHLYSRTRDFSTDFADALALADLAFVAPIYGAREEPIAGVTSELITEASQHRGDGGKVKAIGPDNDAIIVRLRSTLRSNDLLVGMGAGDIHIVGESLAGGAP